MKQLKTKRSVREKIFLGLIVSILPLTGHSWTPLHGAARLNDVEEAKRLIKNGADLYAEEIKTTGTPLHTAAYHNATETAKLLIKKGVDVNVKDHFGETPLHYAAQGSATETAILLIKKGANINATDNWESTLSSDGDTPLHEASYSNAIEIARFLISKGANVNAKNNSRRTPLHDAAQGNATEIAELLIGKGVDVNAKSSYGITPLHQAAVVDAIEVATLLIKKGAYPNATTSDGETPLYIARKLKSWGVVSLLEDVQPQIAFTNSNTAESVFEKTWRSVVVIHNGNIQGSGVIIRPNIVATNCHVVEQSSRIVVYKATGKRIKTDYGFPAQVRFADTQKDLCLLDVHNLQGPPAKIRRYNTLKVGETVYGLGAPAGFDLTLTEGLISQLRKVHGYSQIQTDAAISPGASGGGLFDVKGNLIGLMTWKLAEKSIEGIGFAIPADLVFKQ